MTRARLTIKEIYQRADKAERMAAVYFHMMAEHTRLSRAATVALSQVKVSSERLAKLAGDIQSDLEWLAAELQRDADGHLIDKVRAL